MRAIRHARAVLLLLAVGCGSADAPGDEPAGAADPPSVERPANAEPAPPPDDASRAAPEPPGLAAPPVVRISVADEAAIDAAVEDALARGAAPGAVVVIGRRDGVVFRRAYGRRAVDPEPEPMTVDTVFDLASVTKAVATATSVMRLAEEGALDLDAPVSRHVPALTGGGRERITARHLLTHSSGLPAVNRLTDYEDGPDVAIERIAALPLEAPPGARVRYSDLGFVLLGELVARVSGRPLDRYAEESIFAPLGMADTVFVRTEPHEPAHHASFGPVPSPGPGSVSGPGPGPGPANPRTVPPASRFAPTERAERRGGVMIRGVVHDPRAWRLGGVSGNAGLFSTADDLSRFARMLLSGGALDGVRVLSTESVARMTARQPLPNGSRGLGWDIGRHGMSAAAFGHGGFTGTSIWIDPERDVFVIFLSNRVHPDGEGDVQPLVRALGPLGVAAAERASPPRSAPVWAGVDVLERDGFAALDGARAALLTHRAARTRDGRRTLDVLHAAPNVSLVRVLAPEHGLASEGEGRIGDARDTQTGLSVFSLFGHQRAPTDAMLAGIDTLVVDLQDVGVRFYTYAATVRRLLEAAAERDLRVVILDRPDPLGGRPPAGPVSDPALRSFVNHHPLPTRHGMTLGELAGYLNAERGIGARLDVVALEGWRRGMRWSDTGLRWVPPSPNLRTPTEVALYPALGLLEGTNVSVGRGTDTPFEVLGAPWIDGEALAAALGSLPGVRVEPTSFTPTASRHRRRRCEGVRLTLADPDAFRPIRTGLTIASALRRLHPDAWDADAMLPLLGDRAVHAALLAGDDVPSLERRWADELAAFEQRRRSHLRYR